MSALTIVRMILPNSWPRHARRGIDVYYENVGGKVFDAVLPLLNTAARVPVCGLCKRL